MPTCPNGHQSRSDDWCEVCGHRMAAAVPPPPPPPPVHPQGPGQPGPGASGAPGAPGEPELCPQCRTPREGGAPFCEQCRWNFLTNTATSYTPVPPRPQDPGPAGGPPLHAQQSARPGQEPYEYQSSAPSRVNRPAEPLAPGAAEFGSGSGPVRPQGPGGPGGPDGPAGPGGAPPAFPRQPGEPGLPPPPPGFHQDNGHRPQSPPPSGPATGGGDDWVLPPPSAPGGPAGSGGPSAAATGVSAPPAPGGSAPGGTGQQPGGAPSGYGYPPSGQGGGPTGAGAPGGPGGSGGPDGPGEPGGQAPPSQWTITIGPDRAYFMSMMQRSGPEAAGLNLPAYAPEQQRSLNGDQVTIGRRRHSTGETPDIDLSVPPEDPGVSHQHAILVRQRDGSWAVVDQNSTNGTTLNGGEDPIQPFVPVVLKDGDRVHVGAWTTITIRRD